MDLVTPEASKLNATTYLMTTRYTTGVFHGVVIDTGASKKSTAGYDQYLAYERTYSGRIDTTKAGMIKVQFGIGTTSSIGSITVTALTPNTLVLWSHALSALYINNPLS